MNKYDVVIIGSGLGGLLCGYVLSKEGFNVCVAEKNQQTGGCLQVFKRNGCTFDTGIHYIGSMDKGQILNRYFKYFDLTDNLKLKKLDENGYDIINFGTTGKSYKFAMGESNFIDSLLQEFPREKQALNTYIYKLNEINDSLNLINLRQIDTYNLIKTEYIKVNAFEFLKSITSNTKLQQVLAGNNSIYAGDADKTPLYMLALIQKFFIDSAWRLVDGSDQIANLLEESIIKNNGTILTKYEANKIVFENDVLKGVEFTNGEKFEAKYVISDIHPSLTLDIMDTNRLKGFYRKRIHSLENTVSTFSLYAVLKENSLPYINANHYVHKTDDVWGIKNYSEENWPKGYMLLTPASSKSGQYADSLIVITYMKFKDVERWSNTSIEKRGDEYLQFKNDKAEILLKEVEKTFPGIRNHIQTFYTSSPLTYRDYTGTIEGSMYGIVKDCNNPLESYIPPRTKIPNFFFTGQNINMHGALGVTIGAILTCGEIIGLNYLIKRINDAQ